MVSLCQPYGSEIPGPCLRPRSSTSPTVQPKSRPLLLFTADRPSGLSGLSLTGALGRMGWRCESHKKPRSGTDQSHDSGLLSELLFPNAHEQPAFPATPHSIAHLHVCTTMESWSCVAHVDLHVVDAVVWLCDRGTASVFFTHLAACMVRQRTESSADPLVDGIR